MCFCKCSCSFHLDVAMVSWGAADEIRMHLGSKPGPGAGLWWLHLLPNKVEVAAWRSPWKKRGSMWLGPFRGGSQVTWNNCSSLTFWHSSALFSEHHGNVFDFKGEQGTGMFAGISRACGPLKGPPPSSWGEIMKVWVINKIRRLWLCVCHLGRR